MKLRAFGEEEFRQRIVFAQINTIIDCNQTLVNQAMLRARTALDISTNELLIELTWNERRKGLAVLYMSAKRGIWRGFIPYNPDPKNIVRLELDRVHEVVLRRQTTPQPSSFCCAAAS